MGRQLDDGDTADLQMVLDIDMETPEAVPARSRAEVHDLDATVTAPAPTLAPDTREWFVALALSEPWLTGTDDYPRPPSNREIYERIKGWRGHAWNLDRSQRVDDAIRAISRVAFGPRDDPFTAGAGRAQNVRFAIGRRAAEVRLVTVEDLQRVEGAARERG